MLVLASIALGNTQYGSLLNMNVPAAVAFPRQPALGTLDERFDVSVRGSTFQVFLA